MCGWGQLWKLRVCDLASEKNKFITKHNNFEVKIVNIRKLDPHICKYEGWNFNSGNYLFTTDTK